MRKTTRFKKLVQDPPILVLPAVHDALSARIIEQAGFRALALGGYATSATLLGKPDVSLLTLTEMADQVARIADAVDLPILADGDTGHGGVLNVMRTVKAMERAGAAALFIEDQLSPKRCGHMDGKRVIPVPDMVAKIKAALDARSDPDFCIMARTDALAPLGIDEAIERGKRYREAGADIVFVEAPTTIAEMIRITTEIDGPVMANNVEGGKTPLLSAPELEAIGYDLVAFATAATYAVTRALQEIMAVLKRTGSTREFQERMCGFDEFNEMIGLNELRHRESRYLESPTGDQEDSL